MADNPFASLSDESPIIRRRNLNHHPHSVPIWGTFLILLALVSGAVFWFGRDYYRRHYGIGLALQQMEDEAQIHKLMIEGDGEVQRARLSFGIEETAQEKAAREEKWARQFLSESLWWQAHGYAAEYRSKLERILEEYPATQSAIEARKRLRQLSSDH